MRELKQSIGIFAFLGGLALIGFAIYVMFFSANPELIQTVEEKTEELSWAINSTWILAALGASLLVLAYRLLVSPRPQKSYLQLWREHDEKRGCDNARREAERLSRLGYDDQVLAFHEGKATGYRR
ncbi:MAG TPA: hypothetical protein VMQ44_02440 [Candidatus Saccharimonadales bacterium]|nr:hypothetical protein [Candidatus Saccharimonadales bacterium]